MVDLGSNKIAKNVSAAPIGAIGGAIVGYLVSKKLGYDKTLTVVSFAMVGILIGAAFEAHLKK